MKKVIKYVSVAVAIALLFTGCNSDKNKSGGNTAQNTAPLVLQVREFSSFNPFTVSNHTVRDAFFLCYEPLFTVGENMQLEGVLASTIQVSDDCKSAVITLKDSASWHDGVKFTSADVAHTISLLFSNPTWEYADCVKYIDSVQTISPVSLRLNLTRPYSQIGYSLYFPIVAAHNANLEENMIGTGAYRFEKYQTSTLLEFKSYDKWHGGEALCPSVSVSVIRDNESATTAFNTGLINTITSDSFDLHNFTPKSNSRTTAYPSNNYEYMAFNHSRSVFSSSAVRCAVSTALDRSTIVKECYAGNAYAANAPVHPLSGFLSEASVLSQYSLTGAEEMLFLEGYSLDERTNVMKNEKGEALSFDILVNEENPDRIKTAESIQNQLSLLGVAVTVTKLSFEEYEEKIRMGSYDAYIGGIRFSNLYDYEVLLAQTGKLNTTDYHDEYMALALAALGASPSEDSLSDAVLNFDEVFTREQPICGLCYRSDILITAENVLGKLQPKMNFPYKNIANWSIK